MRRARAGGDGHGGPGAPRRSVAYRAARECDANGVNPAGTLSVNSNTSVRVATPFGGVTQSGMGRGLGMHALAEYSNLKNVFVSTER